MNYFQIRQDELVFEVLSGTYKQNSDDTISCIMACPIPTCTKTFTLSFKAYRAYYKPKKQSTVSGKTPAKWQTASLENHILKDHKAVSSDVENQNSASVEFESNISQQSDQSSHVIILEEFQSTENQNSASDEFELNRNQQSDQPSHVIILEEFLPTENQDIAFDEFESNRNQQPDQSSQVNIAEGFRSPENLDSTSDNSESNRNQQIDVDIIVQQLEFIRDEQAENSESVNQTTTRRLRKKRVSVDFIPTISKRIKKKM